MASNLDIVRDIRRANLSALLDEHGQAALQDASGIAASYLWQMGKGEGRARRGISDATAKKIEQGLKLEPGALSSPGLQVVPSQPGRLDTIKLANLIEGVDAAIAAEGMDFPARLRARIIAAFYADPGTEPITEQAIRAALSAVVLSLEER